MKYTTFQQLPKIKNKNKSTQSQTDGKPDQEKKPESDTELFRQAMERVEPLSDKGGGRKIAKKPGISEAGSAGRHEQPQNYLQDLVDGKIEFEIALSDEYLQGQVLGLDPHIARKLQAGEFSVEAHLDLHGMTAEEALTTLIRFVKQHYLNNSRCLLIIPGRGKNSPNGRGVLRDQLQTWLTRDPLKRVLLAFSTAQPKHGGPGALYLLLRKYRKNRGKIFWERYSADEP